jgi:hypothetical protein
MSEAALREQAAALFRESGDAALEHVRLARLMSTSVGPAYTAARLRANVADCMARKKRQWAELLELAAEHDPED